MKQYVGYNTLVAILQLANETFASVEITAEEVNALWAKVNAESDEEYITPGE